MKASALDDGPICAVIHLPHQHPTVVHQVTLDKAKLRQTNGAPPIIRLGDFPGDEANGWQFLHSIEIIDILGKATYDAEKKQITITPYDSDALDS